MLIPMNLLRHCHLSANWRKRLEICGLARLLYGLRHTHRSSRLPKAVFYVRPNAGDERVRHFPHPRPAALPQVPGKDSRYLLAHSGSGMRGLVSHCIAIAATIVAAPGLAQEFAAPETAVTLRWQCEPQAAPGGQWVLRCDDPRVRLEDDPALNDGAPKSTWYVPTWSMPVDPDMTVYLIRAALCRGAQCVVTLKMDNRQPAGVVWAGPVTVR